MNLKNCKIYIAGHSGLVGSSLLKILKKTKNEIITISKKKLDLLDTRKVNRFLKKKKPDYVVICAAKVGGIKENLHHPVEFFLNNSLIQNNLIHGSFLAGVKNLIFLGSSCIYPKHSKQPIKENQLLSGKLESTNQAYAIAKIGGVELCRSYNHQYKTNYKCLMPTNLYGPRDNYKLDKSHFFAACIRKVYEAKIKNKKFIIFWGTGKAKREAMFVDDLAQAIIYFMKIKTKHYLINIGSGYEKTIKVFINHIARVMEFDGKIYFNNDKLLDGTPRKKLCTQIAKKYGWKSIYKFDEAMRFTIQDFIKNYNIYKK